MASFDSNFSAILALIGSGSGNLDVVLTNGNTTGDNALIVSNPAVNPNARIQGEDSGVGNAGELILRGGNSTAGDGGDVTISAGTGTGNDGTILLDGDTEVTNGNFTAPLIRYGTGSPEGVVTAPVGAIYSRLDGSAGSTLYTKISGVGNTGWIPVGTTITESFEGVGPATFMTSSNFVYLPMENIEPRVHLNGIRQRSGMGNDYTITGVNQITFAVAPFVGDVIIIDYLPAN